MALLKKEKLELKNWRGKLFYEVGFHNLCTNDLEVMPLNFFPQNQKMIPQEENSVIRAMFIRIGGLKPLSSAQGVRNLLQGRSY